ncbi:hypothetical protein T03_18028 [Trichinella britovi]|uniref:Uncharacterized protein n=1 Tax=Trichinella britovi TaxID=45882 RepID=A0A0V1BIU0_TRIBR|nr:hypothetical protein T03_18028 [Trichinella britovi]
MLISRVINAFSKNSFALRLEEVIDNTGQHGFEELADLGESYKTFTYKETLK